jgi:T4-like virus tail tube protein gp19.
MAILRGGKRIGGYDVRIGIPRDRSLDDVAGDKRLQRRQGSNPATTIGRFQSYVNEAEGFARKARFYAEFSLPKGISDGALFSEGFEDTSSAALEKQAFPTQKDLLAVQQANGRRVRAFCSSISMPEREMTTKEVRHGNAPARNFVYDMKSAPISATFYADKFMRERSYFELWQKAAMSTSETFNTNYYDNYVSNLNIFQLGQFASRQERDDVTYGVQLIDCYPTKIGAIDYSHDTNNVQTIDVDFSF